jgi:hydroxyacylglutathione hydrolase
VFVGDVGRPDLLEKAAHVTGAADASARVLYRSLEWFKGLPDHLQVWPGHGAGSACGKGIGAVPQSTVGYERRTNWAMAIDEEEAFVAQVLLGQPEPPKYFGVMKRINRDGPALLGRIPTPERISERRLATLLAERAVVVDARSTAAYATGFIPGTVNLPLGRSFATYAGSLLPYDQDIYLLVDGGPAAVEQAVRVLISIGLDRVAGYLGPEVIDIWRTAGHPVDSVEQVSVEDLSAGRNGRLVVDVRGEAEWQAGHLKDSILVPLPELPDRLADIPSGRQLVVLCQTGSRSAVAASYLRSRGWSRASNLAGGIAGWINAGHAVEH